VTFSDKLCTRKHRMIRKHIHNDLSEKEERQKNIDNEYKKIDGGKETNTESGARHRTFGVWPHSMGLARVRYRMQYVGGTLLQ